MSSEHLDTDTDEGSERASGSPKARTSGTLGASRVITQHPRTKSPDRHDKPSGSGSGLGYRL